MFKFAAASVLPLALWWAKSKKGSAFALCMRVAFSFFLFPWSFRAVSRAELRKTRSLQTESLATEPAPSQPSRRRPVLLVTDLGRDVDDTMCLHMLAHEQFDNKTLELVGVVTCGGSTLETACIGQCSRFVSLPFLQHSLTCVV